MNFYLKTFLLLLLLSLSIFGIHYLIVDHPTIPLWKTYSFLGVAAFITVSALKYVFGLVPDKLGFAFLALVFIKFGIVLIMFPELITGPSLSKVEVLGFLIPYFIFLFLEAAIVIKWLNKN
ncbi:hypothetical protein BST92_05435 [Nonlabens arenilitoris]|uniref:ATP synthase protein I2 n=1 Tax=Nonlabens arenilitoris TaxID=1217969 RepID=A0A2S7U8Z3_9FLAO|nr:hypothetical protein [Nonlabens arenilitoris]PQJ31398.1 hypothetical protein BST92_05435 [Nonlabens arenilitoris]